MKQTTPLKSLVAHGDKSYDVAVIIGWGAIVCFMAYNLRNELFRWERFNPNGINTILFLLFVLVEVLVVVNAFDKGPRLIIDDKGIRKPKSRLFFFSLVL